MYYKYEIEKEQVSYDNGQTWTDTYVTRRSDNYVGVYNTLSECEGEEPPTPPTPSSGYSTQYLTFDILSSGTINWKRTGLVKTISYSKDSGSTWTSITSTASGTSFNVSAGEKVWFKGNNSTYATNENTYASFYGSTAYFNVYGNIMSLISGDTFENATSFNGMYVFNKLFNESNVVNSNNLVLPVLNLSGAWYCYAGMFKGCTSLITTPVLPATTLERDCYANMFEGCTSLTTAPQLTATTLADFCYYQMFSGCTSLTTAPALPATTLASSCYREMFYNCTSLTTAPNLPATTLVNYYCYDSMFRGCTSLTTAPQLPATTLAEYCYERMFQDCTSLTTAPALPATTLANSCYTYMFYGCTSLTTAPALPATTLVDFCYDAMFFDCTNLNSITCLATNISANRCTANWVYNVASSGTFTKASSMTGWDSGISGIPNNWTVQNA